MDCYIEHNQILDERQYKLTKYDSLYDGNRNLAMTLVKIWKYSDMFRLTIYEKQDEFYQYSMDKFEEYYKYFRSLSHGDSMDIYEIDKIKKYVLSKLELNQLKFVDMLYAYLAILYAIDNVTITLSGKRTNTKRQWTGGSGYWQSFHEYMNPILTEPRYNSYVPFTSKFGTFGINTYLYLAFNGLHPIGITLTPYPVHGGIYKNKFREMIEHDIGHEQTRLKLCQSEFDNYVYIMNNKDILGEDKVKGFIYLLFVCIHELGISVKCNLKSLRELVTITANKNNIVDFWEFLYFNKLYCPKMFGYDTPNVNKLYKTNMVNFRTLRRAIFSDMTTLDLINYCENMYAQLITDYCSFVFH